MLSYRIEFCFSYHHAIFAFHILVYMAFALVGYFVASYAVSEVTSSICSVGEAIEAKLDGIKEAREEKRMQLEKQKQQVMVQQ